jgi:hypothetical protein
MLRLKDFLKMIKCPQSFFTSTEIMEIDDNHELMINYNTNSPYLYENCGRQSEYKMGDKDKLLNNIICC